MVKSQKVPHQNCGCKVEMPDYEGSRDLFRHITLPLHNLPTEWHYTTFIAGAK